MRRWFAYEGVWKSKEQGVWIKDQPPIPSWGDPLDVVEFIRIWVSSQDLNTVRKSIFWMSLEELDLTVSEISACLIAEGYNPLPERTMREKGLFSSEQLLELEDQGFISLKQPPKKVEQPSESEQDSSEDYDVVKALLSSPQSPYEPLSHIETTEAGRFRAKH